LSKHTAVKQFHYGRPHVGHILLAVKHGIFFSTQVGHIFWPLNYDFHIQNGADVSASVPNVMKLGQFESYRMVNRYGMETND